MLTTHYFCVLLLVFAIAGNASAQMTDVLTYHNDNVRTGQALHEEVLNFSSVNANHFGRLRVLPTDGKVDAEPLYAAGVNLPGVGLRNLLIVATENDTVYAFDADGTNTFWRASMLASGEVPSDSRNCGQVIPAIGVTSTPVIDRQLGPNGTVFVAAMSTDHTHYFQRLHALDLATGDDRVPPTAVAATYPGSGDGSSNGVVVFNPAQYEERAGLLLLNGVVYTSWSSHCDIRPYTGWIIGFDQKTLARVSVLNITPNGGQGAIWMSGGALAADAGNNIYFLAGNGTFDTTLTADGFPSKGDFANGFIKLATTNGTLTVADYFATFATPSQNAQDLDLGSGGLTLLPDMIDAQGNTRQLAVGAGKDQNLYVVDRSNMGKFNPLNDNAIYQKLSGALTGTYSSPAYFNGTLYIGSREHPLMAFPIQNARLLASSSHTTVSFEYPGATPSISANGTNNGIVWAVENVASAAVLRAYAATNLSVELYDSNQAGTRDHFGGGNKFITPLIASARVYVGTPNGVGVLGLLDQSTLTPLQKWRDDHFANPSNVGAGANAADPAGDGMPNLVKYALGLDPFVAASASQVLIPSLGQTNGQFYATLTIRRAAQPPDVTYIIEVSSDMNTWSSGPTVTSTLTDSPSELTVQDKTPLGSTPRFMRLRITTP